MAFTYHTNVHSDWIDYNGHMQDAYYGLVFSHGVDALQDEVGFDHAYRDATGCTIYLVEEHKYFLKEVKYADALAVNIHLISQTDKLFHLYAEMICAQKTVALCELIEMHVQQKPCPHGVPIPQHIAHALSAYQIKDQALSGLKHRSRRMRLR